MKGIIPSLERDTPQHERDEQTTTHFDDLLGASLQKKWDQWKVVRREIESRWLEDLRAYNQENDPDASKLSKFHSHIYIGRTRMKCDQALSQISNIMFNGRDDHWGIEPTPVPMDMANDPSSQGFIDEMKRRSDLMQTEMSDQLIDMGYEEILKAAIRQACVLGTGVIKGVIPSVKKIERWGMMDAAWDVVSAEMPAPQIGWVDVFNIYPDPYAFNVADVSGVFERHVLNRAQFAALKDDARFDAEKIEEIIRTTDKGNHQPEWYETSQRALAKVTDTTGSQSERFDVLEYWGQVSGKMLLSSGIEDVEEDDTYWACVWTCSGRTLLSKIMPQKKQRIPYNFFFYSKIPHNFWGLGVARMVRSEQLMENGLARALLDGMAMSAVPQCEVNINMLKDGQNPAVQQPGQVWLRDNGDPAVPAVRYFQPSIPFGQMLQVDEMVRALSEETTALPSYAMGLTSPMVDDKTARGTSMRMNAASLPMKLVVKNLEDGLVKPLIKSLYDWNMQWSDKEDIKGDMDVQVYGSPALIREERSQKILQFLATTANPLDAPKVDRAYLIKELAKAIEIDAEKAVPDEMPQQMGQQPDPEAMAKAELIKAQTEKTLAEATVKKIEGQYSAIQGAQAIATMPAITPIADQLLLSAGYQDANGAPIAQPPAQAANLPTRYAEQRRINVNENTDPRFPANPPSPAVGMMQGIETPENDAA